MHVCNDRCNNYYAGQLQKKTFLRLSDACDRALCYLQKEDAMVHAMVHWGTYGWGMGFGWVYMIIFWAAIITAVLYLVKFVEKKLDGENEAKHRLT